MHEVAIIRGDGIGPEISEAAVRVIEAAGARIRWHETPVGEAAVESYGAALPIESLRRIKQLGAVLKAPLVAGRCTGGVIVEDGGQTRRHPSINNGLRRELSLFVNVRPVRGWSGISGGYAGMDTVIMREITEDVYAGIERAVGEDAAEAVKRITGHASRRIARFSCEYALRHGRRKVTAIHKANVLHLTDGLFLKSVREVVAGYPGVEFEEQAIDAACYLMVKSPAHFDVMVLPNQYGDIISDLAAGLAGSLGLAPGANIGEECAMFEAAHGAAPDIAGRGIANPIALVLSGALLLDHLGESGAAARVRASVASVLEDGAALTPDLGGCATTREMTAALCAAIQTVAV